MSCSARDWRIINQRLRAISTTIPCSAFYYYIGSGIFKIRTGDPAELIKNLKEFMLEEFRKDYDFKLTAMMTFDDGSPFVILNFEFEPKVRPKTKTR